LLARSSVERPDLVAYPNPLDGHRAVIGMDRRAGRAGRLPRSCS
jgi:hypothetical protein